MHFVDGKIVSDEACDFVLEHMEERLADTLRKPPLDIELVINACDALVKKLDSLAVIKRLPELGFSPVLAELYRKQITHMLGANALRERLAIELGVQWDTPRTLTYLHSGATAVQRVAPLGVLFHITAGNVEGLPFVSLLDGLLTGNINIIKLPKEEGGVTVSLLEALIALAPALAEYVYVFDYASKDVHAMRKLMSVADAVVVWGGDEAVSAVRKLAAPNTKIIEWGHKISFAYATKAGLQKAALEKLAAHICMTNQLFCSACQGVFLDTDSMQDVYDFCEQFLPIFEAACRENPFALDASARLFLQADITLQHYHRLMENKESPARVFRAQNCSITALPDSRLETSALYRNLWAKPLPRENILALRPYKNYLQTAALLCARPEHETLARQLMRAGLVKVSDGFEMSNYAFGEAHDGVFTLRAYTRLVSVQEAGGEA